MEIHIQKCQNCGSRNVRNVLVRDHQQKVFVQCRDCDHLVARYVLTTSGYFHAGKGFESFLRSVERDGGFSSGRDLQTWFEELEVETLEEFEQVKEKIAKKYDNLP